MTAAFLKDGRRPRSRLARPRNDRFALPAYDIVRTPVTVTSNSFSTARLISILFASPETLNV
ncbi:hypothetical protein D3C83_335000 [compost metagenome]